MCVHLHACVLARECDFAIACICSCLSVSVCLCARMCTCMCMGFLCVLARVLVFTIEC